MEKKTIKVVTPHKSLYRLVVQVFFFALVALISLNDYLKRTGQEIPFLSTASLHAICPFGGVVSLYKFFTVGTFVQKIHESSFVLMTLGILLAIAFGPVICGWVCPLGSFQEWISTMGKKIFGRRFNTFVPAKVDRYLRYLRYFVLAMVVYKTASSAKLMFQDIDPYYALFNFWAGDVSLKAFALLGVIIVASLFIERPWCKYLCPYGALLGLFNKFRLFKIRRSASTCIDCKACDKACPMNITVSTSTAVLNHQCISCMQCTSENACPIANTVDFSTKGGK